jgi:hypothetical protein
VHQGIQPVGYDDGHPFTGLGLNRRPDPLFRACIHGGGAIVEDQHRGAEHQRPCDGHALALAAR